MISGTLIIVLDRYVKCGNLHKFCTLNLSKSSLKFVISSVTPFHCPSPSLPQGCGAELDTLMAMEAAEPSADVDKLEVT